jgi:hypothetical protein
MVSTHVKRRPVHFRPDTEPDTREPELDDQLGDPVDLRRGELPMLGAQFAPHPRIGHRALQRAETRALAHVCIRNVRLATDLACTDAQRSQS